MAHHLEHTSASDTYAAITPAHIGRGALCQHAVQELDQGAVILLATALGAPRLWAYLLSGALDGFCEGYGRPHDGRASTRLHQGMLVAQQTLRRRVENLIERHMSDVGLLALARESDVLHVLSAGPAGAYIYQARSLRPLGADAGLAGGLLKVTPSWSAEQIYPGDLVFATSRFDGTDDALETLESALSGSTPAPEQVVSLLSEPARTRGLPAAALALRVPLS